MPTVFSSVAVVTCETGWMPEVSETAGPTPLVHWVAEDAARAPRYYEEEFVARCGASCYPLHGPEPADPVTRHGRCPVCDVPDGAVG